MPIRNRLAWMQAEIAEWRRDLHTLARRSCVT